MASALSTRSEEYRRVEYLLKLSLGSFAPPSHVQVWHFTNPQQTAKFELHHRNSPVIHAWLLEEEACEELIRNQGTLTRFPQRFETGAIAPPNTRRRDLQRVVLCQIALGKCFVQDYSEANVDGGNRLPDGFDSILQSNPDFHAMGADEEEPTYHHEYVLFNSYQCLPMYIVQYEVANGGKRRSGREEESNLYDKYDFFDPVYYVPVSIRDKMVGSHSKGEAANHKLISLQDAYEIALKESEKPDLLLRQTTQELKNQLRTVDTKLRDVNGNSAKVEEELYKCLQDALFELQQLTQNKMQSLLSVEVELKRKLSHLEWAEQYLAVQRVEATPLDFLTVWKCHSQLRGDICHSEQQQQEDVAFELQAIQPDIEFTGSIHVRQAADGRPLALAATPYRSSRRGSGSMVLNGHSPSQSELYAATAGGGEIDEEAPTLFLEDTPKPSPHHPPMHTVPPPPVSLQQPQAPAVVLPEPNLDVSKAFVEALRQQSRLKSSAADPFGDNKRRHAAGNGFLLQNEEVPPSPPPVYKKTNAPRLTQFSIYEEACRKIRLYEKHRRQGFVDYLHGKSPKFTESQLLSHAITPVATDKSTEQYFALSPAVSLFLALPVDFRIEPQLLYSSHAVGTPRLSDMVSKLPRQQLVERGEDGQEIVTETLAYCPTLLLIRANGNRVFGGYIADPFSLTSGPFGTPRSFLVSVDRDLKIPFVGRETLPPNQNLVAHCLAQGLTPPKFAAMFCDDTKLQFGVGDLVLGYD
ncbi:hypothetical protein BASA82_000615 [Batrachochytrium salamandrivorans]|nr:hypothetical protein BASA82_000615 [Batrachochytrium salamandrivorans]